MILYLPIAWIIIVIIHAILYEYYIIKFSSGIYNIYKDENNDFNHLIIVIPTIEIFYYDNNSWFSKGCSRISINLVFWNKEYNFTIRIKKKIIILEERILLEDEPTKGYYKDVNEIPGIVGNKEETYLDNQIITDTILETKLLNKIYESTK